MLRVTSRIKNFNLKPYFTDFAAVGALCSSWASLKQNGLFLGVLTSYSPLSSGLANSMGGLICSSRFGWPLVFYFHAVFGFVVFTTWAILYTDLPQHSPKVTEIELEKIQRHKNEIQINGTKMIPYMVINLFISN
jgi:MFS family permease